MTKTKTKPTKGKKVTNSAKPPAKVRRAKGTAQTTTEGNLTVVETPPAEVISFPMTQPSVGECLKGGDHEWTQDADGDFCNKCKEPRASSSIAPRATDEPKQKAKRTSAIDAAAQLLATASAPMNCFEMIEAMATQGLWASPGGKTPHATLYSAIIREIGLKGEASRFAKAERGRFTLRATSA